MKFTFCTRCPLGQSPLPVALAQALSVLGISAELAEVDCMSGCARSSTASVRQEGKTAYLFGDLSQDDLADLVTFAQLYAQSTDGTFADARPLGALREKVIARIPA